MAQGALGSGLSMIVLQMDPQLEVLKLGLLAMDVVQITRMCP